MPKSHEGKEILEDLLYFSEHSRCTVRLSPSISCQSLPFKKSSGTFEKICF